MAAAIPGARVRSGATPQFDAVLAGRLRSGRPPVLAVCADAVCASGDPNGDPSLALVGAERLFQDRRSPLIPAPDASATTGKASAARFGHGRRPRRLFASVRSSLAVYAWDGCVSASDTGVPRRLSCSVIRQDVGHAHHIAVNHADSLVAACVHDAVVVVAVAVAPATAVCLQGHAARVTVCEFFPHQPPSSSHATSNWLLTLSEDRTFKIWDVGAPTCLYSSSILSQSPLTAIAFDPIRPIFAIGSEDGVVRFFDPTPRTSGTVCEPRMIHSINVTASARKWSDAALATATAGSASPTNEIKAVSSLPVWRQPPHADAASSLSAMLSSATLSAAAAEKTSIDSDDSVQHAFCILSLFYPHAPPPMTDATAGLAPPARLLVACPIYIAIIDANSYTLLHLISFSRPNLNIDMFETEQIKSDQRVKHTDADTLPTAQFVAFAQPAGIWRCWFVALEHTFTGQVTLLRIHEAPPPRLLNHATQSGIQSNRSIPNTSVGDSSTIIRETVKSAIDKQLVGKKWVDNVFSDCMRQLTQLGIHDVHDLPKFLDRLDRHDDADGGNVDDIVPILPLYVERALRELVDDVRGVSSVSSSLLSLVEDPLAPVAPSSVLKIGSAANESQSPVSRTRQGSKADSITVSTPTRKARPANTSSLLDKPLTFRSKVKSSGYTEAPKATKMFSGTQTRSPAKPKASLSLSSYPCTGGPPSVSVTRPPITVVPHTSGMTCVRFHPSGRLLGTAASDKCARFYRMSVTKNADVSTHISAASSRDFNDHDALVSDLCWRTRPVKNIGHVILTTSMDGHVRLWGTNRADPLLDIMPGDDSPRRAPPRIGISTSPPSATSPPPLSVTARFFYNDRFIVTSAGPRIDIYSYHVVHMDPAVIRSPTTLISSTTSSFASSTRQRRSSNLIGQESASFSNTTTARVVGSLDIDAQTVTSLSCANTYTSRNIITATSNRRILLWDVGAHCVVREWHGAHTRAAHWVTLSDDGHGVPASPFDHVFVSVAVGDGVKLWDIRMPTATPSPSSSATTTGLTATSAMHLVGHVNRQLPLIRCAISPCHRYIAVGSEDHHAYTYDIRTGLVVSKTDRNHGAAVTDVAFHPDRPLMATACLDGRVRFFS